jgi:hypothetical protein
VIAFPGEPVSTSPENALTGPARFRVPLVAPLADHAINKRIEIAISSSFLDSVLVRE